MSERVSLAVVMTGLLVMNLAAYGQIVRHEFVSYDTALYVYENPVVRDGLSAAGLRWAFDPRHAYAGNWHPLTWLSHMVDCQFFGVERAGAHLAVNLALHVVNTWLLFLVLWQMSRTAAPHGAKKQAPPRPAPTAALWNSALVAALFGLHPLHVESVAWLAERKDVLSGLFWMLTMGAYGWYAARPCWGRMALVAACLALGLMSKPMLVTLPFALLLLDVWPLGRASFSLGSPALAQWRRLVLEKLPLFALVLAASAVTYVVQRQAGAVNVAQSFAQRVVAAVWAYGMYLVQMVWPLNLACFYPLPGAGLKDSHQYQREVALLAVLLLGVTALAVWQRRQRPYLLVGWLWYLGTLVPVIGMFVQVGEQAMADRYTYIPLIGVFVMLAWGVADVGSARSWPRPVLAAAALAVVGLLAVLTWRQARVWRDTETLFRHATLVTDHNAFAHTSLGIELRLERRLDEALAECQRAVDIDPNDWNNQQNLALVLVDLDRLDQAARHAREAVRRGPREATPRGILGTIHARQGRPDEAVAEFEEALRLNPSFAKVRLLLAQSLETLGRWPDAVAEYRRAVALEPGNAAARAALASALSASGAPQEAIDALQAAIRLDPANVDYPLAAGRLLASVGRFAEAAQQVRQALALRPDSIAALRQEAELLLRDGQPAAAIERYRTIVRLAPGERAAVNNLAWLLAAHGAGPADRQEAVALAERLQKSGPQASPDLLDTLALAYAAAGRFDDAVRAAEQARDAARHGGNQALEQALDARLKAYRAGRLPALE